MTDFSKLIPAVLLVFVSLTVSGCSSTTGTNAETRDKIDRLNGSRERFGGGR